MNKKKAIRAASGIVCGVLCLSLLPIMGSCKKKSKKDTIVIMTEELSGLFNPFYATSGTDQDVVGMTQIGMLSTDSNGNPVAGDDLPTAVKAFDQKTVTSGGSEETVYTFVLKNGLKFSDGEPLTMNDVLFNMYEYLDPVYMGSSTMYSIDIKGLSQYRTQTNYSGGGDEAELEITSQASALAELRILELLAVYENNGLIAGSTSSYSLTEEQMKAAIAAHDIDDNAGYKDAVASTRDQEKMTEADYRNILLEDYEFALKTFREELESDFRAAKESYDTTTAPYKDWANELSSDVFKFFLYEGYIVPEYNKIEGKIDRTKILKFDGTSFASTYTTEEEAINKVYVDTVVTQFNRILTQWGTAGTLTTHYTAAAKDVLLHNNMDDDGSLLFPNISGIVSLGHTTDETQVSVKGNTYQVAQSHKEDGTPANADEYDVLQITVNGSDPKAIYSFGFSVAPAHYYTADNAHPNGRPIDITKNQFGVEFASSEFQTKVIQSPQHVEVPVGAGAYMATDENNGDAPSGADFVSGNTVYFKANRNFMFEVKAEKIRMQVASSSNALDKLENGEVDYVVPQFTKTNSNRLQQMEKKGFKQLSSWQLGYGYIGINAGKVPDVNVRRAIMAAMQTSLALEYYEAGTCKTIDWPMSTVSWAYPYEDDNVTSKPNGHVYTQWTGVDAAKRKIQGYMNDAGLAPGDKAFEITFTIAGASITDHPTYTVFKQAAEILNDLEWNVNVKADSQALTKLSTGALEVWAAAWGSTIDPDMYQVYHKNSSATSVYAWGYREIKSNPTLYDYETGVINELSELIDEGRTITDQALRKPIYEEAMSLVLDLAVELPVYQRMALYAYNTNTIRGLTENVNPYTSPLEKIWELELV